MTATRLTKRAVIRVSPQAPDESAVNFLQGLVTNDLSGALPVWAALLTPQGKALFDFLVWPAGDDLLIDCEGAIADTLVRRLSLYRLRRKITIARDDGLAVHWQAHQGCGAAPDPRLAELGSRWTAPLDSASESESGTGNADDLWLAHRLRLGVTEGQAELGDGQTLWLECNAIELHGVSFEKGCYIGQENTARMKWRQKINRRLMVVPIALSNPARQRAAYPNLGLAVDHMRMADCDPELLPSWLPAETESA